MYRPAKSGEMNAEPENNSANPTQGFNTSGRLDDCKKRSTYFLGENSKKAQGAATVNRYSGKCVRFVRACINVFDSIMTILVPRSLCVNRRHAILREYCFFYFVTIGPLVLWGWYLWAFIGLPLLCLLNLLRRSEHYWE